MLNRVQKKKHKRTVTVLLTISLFFCLRYLIVQTYSCTDSFIPFSWLPFSLLCIATEIVDLYTNSGLTSIVRVFYMIYFSPGDMMFAYLLCHLVGVTSTVTNPILYAMLNCNFQKEFQIVAGKISGLILRKCDDDDVLVHENAHANANWNAMRNLRKY